MSGRYDGLDYASWVKRVSADGLSVARMKRAVNKEHGGQKAGFTGVFREEGTFASKGMFRFNPVRVNVGEMSDEEKAKLKAELESVLQML